MDDQEQELGGGAGRVIGTTVFALAVVLPPWAVHGLVTRFPIAGVASLVILGACGCVNLLLSLLR